MATPTLRERSAIARERLAKEQEEKNKQLEKIYEEMLVLIKNEIRNAVDNKGNDTVSVNVTHTYRQALSVLEGTNLPRTFHKFPYDEIDGTLLGKLKQDPEFATVQELTSQCSMWETVLFITW